MEVRSLTRPLLLGCVALAALLTKSCIKPPDYSEIPEITYTSISKSTVNEGNDTVRIVFSFTDGDGDIGPINELDSTSNILITDSRDNSTKPFQTQFLTPGGNVKAISGEIAVSLYAFACSAGVTEDQVTYTVRLKDRAGHVSNAISTEPITINCQ
jgi:hypothetical protein